MTGNYILVRCITLMYRQSQLDIGVNASGDMVSEAAATVQLPETVVGSSEDERSLLVGLKTMVMQMAKSADGTRYIADDILQKVRAFAGRDDSIYESLKEGISGEMPEQDLRIVISNIRHELNTYLKSLKGKDLLAKKYKDIMFGNDDSVEFSRKIADLRQELEGYERSDKEVDPAVVNAVSLSNIQAVLDVFTQAQELNNDEGIMKTGWQGLNRMLQGGFRRGEFAVVGALQHNFKTGFSLSTFKHLALYNKPYMVDPKKKPLLLRISFEDPLTLNLPFLYRNISENITGAQADVGGTSPEEMAKYVVHHLQENGYDVMMLHVNPSMWGYRDLFDLVLDLIAQGYEIHALWLDYLNMLGKEGLDNTGPTGSNIRELFRRSRNFTSPRKILTLTPHQLSTEAKMLIRQGNEENFVRDIANKGYWDSCKTIDQEVDLELYIHIVKADSRSWLTVQRGKHRLINQTAEEHKYCVLPFEDVGDIRDDLNGPDTSRKKPGGNAIGSNAPTPFWDFE